MDIEISRITKTVLFYTLKLKPADKQSEQKQLRSKAA